VTRVAYYKGCLASLSAKELDTSTQALAPKLGIELDELQSVTCCGAGDIHEAEPDYYLHLNARILAYAEATGSDTLMTICNVCTLNLRQANHMLQNDEALLARVSENLERVGAPPYSGGVEVKHFLWLVAQGDGHDDTNEPHDGAYASYDVPSGVSPLRHLTPTEHLARDLLSGSLNVGTIDSLIRDARAAKVPYGIMDVEALIGSLRIVGQDNRALLAVDEAGVGHLQSLFFTRYLMHYNVYGHHALRVPTVMFLRAAQDALQAENITSEQLAQQDDAGALALISKAAGPKSSSATLVKRLGDRRPYKRALEFDERHANYASLIRLRDDASWRRRVEEAWARYLTRYRKGVAGPFDILIDLPERGRFDISLRLIRHSPLPGERNPVTWQSVSGLTEEDMARHHAPLHRVRIVTANDDLATSVRRHVDELFTIAEEVG